MEKSSLINFLLEYLQEMTDIHTDNIEDSYNEYKNNHNHRALPILFLYCYYSEQTMKFLELANFQERHQYFHIIDCLLLDEELPREVDKVFDSWYSYEIGLPWAEIRRNILKRKKNIVD